MDRLDRPAARRLLLAAILIGVLTEIALDGPAYGINVPITLGATLAAAWFVRRRDRALDPLDAWLPVTAMVLASLAAIRGDEFLAGLDIAWAVLFGGVSLVAMSGIPVTRRSASVIATMGVWVAAGTVSGPLKVLREARPERGSAPLAGDGRRERIAAILRGMVIGVPLAAIFAVLFASADPIFRRGMSDLLGFRIDLGEVPGRLIFTLSASWLAAGALSVAARGIPDVIYPSLGAVAWEQPPARVVPRSIGLAEALVILGLIDLVVGLFVGLQVAYSFGGPAALASSGFTYAEYARRGFFELVAAASLAAAVVVVLEALVRQRTRSYLAALLGLVGLTGALLVSAMLRLRLYQDAYGWTELRLYVLVAIVTMGVGLAAMAALIIAGRSRWLGHALAVIGVVALVGLNLSAPGAFVAERNIERVLTPSLVPEDGHPGLDSDYLAMLPDDAIPARSPRSPSSPSANGRASDGSSTCVRDSWRTTPPSAAPCRGTSGANARRRPSTPCRDRPRRPARTLRPWPTCTCHSSRRSNRCWPRRRTRSRRTTDGCSNPSGMAFGRSSSVTGIRSTPSRATSSHSIATSPSSPIRFGRRCPSAASSTARS